MSDKAVRDLCWALVLCVTLVCLTWMRVAGILGN